MLHGICISMGRAERGVEAGSCNRLVITELQATNVRLRSVKDLERRLRSRLVSALQKCCSRRW